MQLIKIFFFFFFLYNKIYPLLFIYSNNNYIYIIYNFIRKKGGRGKSYFTLDLSCARKAVEPLVV